MDLQRLKQISEVKIKTGILTKEVRDTLKEYKHNKQDLQQGLSETFKPIIKTQEETKQTIDAKQDKLIKQLQENQKAITSGLENIEMLAIQQPQPQPQQATKLPIGYKPAMMKFDFKSNLDAGFTDDEIEILNNYDLIPPSLLLKKIIKGEEDFKTYYELICEDMKEIGLQKGRLSKTNKLKQKNKDKIDMLTKEIETLQKYRQRILILPEGLKTLSGKGLQPKRNACKINQYGQYGGLMIDIPKLMGQLRLVATIRTIKKCLIRKLILTPLISSQRDSIRKRNTVI